MNDVISVLKDFGFPAIAFGMMFWLCVSTIRNNTKVIQRLEHTVTQFMFELLRREVAEKKCQDSGEK